MYLITRSRYSGRRIRAFEHTVPTTRVYVGHICRVTRFNCCYVVNATRGTLAHRWDEEATARLQLLVKISVVCIFHKLFYQRSWKYRRRTRCNLHLKSFLDLRHIRISPTLFKSTYFHFAIIIFSVTPRVYGFYGCLAV